MHQSRQSRDRYGFTGSEGAAGYLAQRERRGSLAKHAYLDEIVQFQIRQMRASFGYEMGGALERLLIDLIVATWQDYYLFQMVYGQRTNESFTLGDMERWERVLASKEARHLCAIEELARVRRLLHLPPLQ